MTDEQKHEVIGDVVRLYLQALGRKGGACKSARKTGTCRKNLEKGRAIRLGNMRERMK